MTSTRQINEDAKQVWDRIWSVAVKRGYETYKELAKDVEMAPTTLSMVANGRRSFSTSSLIRLSELLNVSREYLEGTAEAKEDRLFPPQDEGEVERDVSADIKGDQIVIIIKVRARVKHAQKLLAAIVQ